METNGKRFEGGFTSAIIGALQTHDEEPATDHPVSAASASYQEHELGMSCMERRVSHYENF
jgi:hypothetical protein